LQHNRAPSFRLPDDKTCPIVMVGAGTGIAPFRSFWQERKIDKEMSQDPDGVNGKGWGTMTLYFGCRQRVVDELYKNEIDQLTKESVINAVYFAYSRESGVRKTYVQEMLLQNIKAVCDDIMARSGHFYICGDVRMAAGVTSAFENGLCKYYNMTNDQAKDYILKMKVRLTTYFIDETIIESCCLIFYSIILKEEMRFHEDIFGNSVLTTSSDNS
jgi:nitric-oxide synthase